MIRVNRLVRFDDLRNGFFVSLVFVQLTFLMILVRVIHQTIQTTWGWKYLPNLIATLPAALLTCWGGGHWRANPACAPPPSFVEQQAHFLRPIKKEKKLRRTSFFCFSSSLYRKREIRRRIEKVASSRGRRSVSSGSRLRNHPEEVSILPLTVWFGRTNRMSQQNYQNNGGGNGKAPSTKATPIHQTLFLKTPGNSNMKTKTIYVRKGPNNEPTRLQGPFLKHINCWTYSDGSK